MCSRRRRSRNNTKNAKSQTKRKKLSCRQRCMRKLRRSICHKIRKCIKKKIFGVPDPHLSDYEMGGYNLGSVKSKFKRDKKKSVTSHKSAKSVKTLYRNKSKPKGSKWNLSMKNIDLIEGMSVKELKKKYSVTGSKERVLENMVKDYNKGKLSLSNVPSKAKYSDRKLDKKTLHEMIKDYETTQKRMNNYSDLDAEDIKRKFSIRRSKEKVLDKMVADYKRGKFSKTMLSNSRGFDPNKMDKKQVNDLINKYEAEQRAMNRKSFMTQSKQRIQDFFDDLKNTDRMQSIVGAIKNRSIYITDVGKRLGSKF